MDSTSSHNKAVASHTLQQLIEACRLLMLWNERVASMNDYLTSPEGMEKMAASCMMIESIGEGCKKIDKLMPMLLETRCPDIPWREVKGMRDHIAHGYFDIDADVVYTVVKEDIPSLQQAFIDIQRLIVES